MRYYFILMAVIILMVNCQSVQTQKTKAVDQKRSPVEAEKVPSIKSVKTKIRNARRLLKEGIECMGTDREEAERKVNAAEILTAKARKDLNEIKKEMIKRSLEREQVESSIMKLSTKK